MTTHNEHVSRRTAKEYLLNEIQNCDLAFKEFRWSFSFGVVSKHSLIPVH